MILTNSMFCAYFFCPPQYHLIHTHSLLLLLVPVDTAKTTTTTTTRNRLYLLHPQLHDSVQFSLCDCDVRKVIRFSQLFSTSEWNGMGCACVWLLLDTIIIVRSLRLCQLYNYYYSLSLFPHLRVKRERTCSENWIGESEFIYSHSYCFGHFDRSI